MKRGNSGFTLVELIVVITILAVLGTIAFVSFQGYALSARDSTRITDVRSIIATIEYYKISDDKYPAPSSSFSVSYSGWLLWSQWSFWEDTREKTKKISNVPLDPLTQTEYAFSVTNSKQEYQIGAILEWGGTALVPNVVAADKIATAYVKGNYNKKFIKTSFLTGSTNYDAIIAVPSILTSEIGTVDLTISEIISRDSFVINNLKNAPAWYIPSGYAGTGGLSYVPADPVIFIGQINDLTVPATRLATMQKLQTAYSWSTLSTLSVYTDIVNVDTSSEGTTGNPSTWVQLITNYLATNEAGIEVDWIDANDLVTIDTSSSWWSASVGIVCPSNPNPDSDFAFNPGTKTITGYPWSNPIVIIPCQIGGVDVEHIDEYAFVEEWISSLTVPNGVLTIGAGAFETNFLNDIFLGNTLTKVDKYAFADNRVSSVTNYDGIVSSEYIYIEKPGGIEIVQYLWADQNLVIPSSINGKTVVSIEAGAFYDRFLTHVTIPSWVNTIGGEAFWRNELEVWTITIACPLPVFSTSVFDSNGASNTTNIPNPTTCTP